MVSPHIHDKAIIRHAVKKVTSFIRDWKKNSAVYVVGYGESKYVYPNHAYGILILNDTQEEVYGKMLKKEGFELLDKRQNPNSGAQLFLYVFDTVAYANELSTPKPKPKPKKRTPKQKKARTARAR